MEIALGPSNSVIKRMRYPQLFSILNNAQNRQYADKYVQCRQVMLFDAKIKSKLNLPIHLESKCLNIQ